VYSSREVSSTPSGNNWEVSSIPLFTLTFLILHFTTQQQSQTCVTISNNIYYKSHAKTTLWYSYALHSSHHLETCYLELMPRTSVSTFLNHAASSVKIFSHEEHVWQDALQICSLPCCTLTGLDVAITNLLLKLQMYSESRLPQYWELRMRSSEYKDILKL
jgi:hypothetical protein